VETVFAHGCEAAEVYVPSQAFFIKQQEAAIKKAWTPVYQDKQTI
jgi:hypothetical protein